MTPHHVFPYLLIEEETGCTTAGMHPQGENGTRRSMSETHTLPEYPDESGLYEIRLKGHLDGRWSDWFEGLTITREDNGDTLLTGPVIDQAALHGLLKKVRDLGIPLISVSPLEAGPSTTLPLRGLRGTGQADQSDVP
jgi:hypothetical protein